MYGQVNYEAEEVLKEGWNPTYITGGNTDKEIVKLVDKFVVESFGAVADVGHLQLNSDEFYFEVVDKPIYQVKNNRTHIIHLLVKKHKL